MGDDQSTAMVPAPEGSPVVAPEGAPSQVRAQAIVEWQDGVIVRRLRAIADGTEQVVVGTSKETGEPFFGPCRPADSIAAAKLLRELAGISIKAGELPPLPAAATVAGVLGALETFLAVKRGDAQGLDE